MKDTRHNLRAVAESFDLILESSCALLWVLFSRGTASCYFEPAPHGGVDRLKRPEHDGYHGCSMRVSAAPKVSRHQQHRLKSSCSCVLHRPAL